MRLSRSGVLHAVCTYKASFQARGTHASRETYLLRLKYSAPRLRFHTYLRYCTVVEHSGFSFASEGRGDK